MRRIGEMEYWSDGMMFKNPILQYSTIPSLQSSFTRRYNMKRSTERILVTHAGTLPQPSGSQGDARREERGKTL